jgi:hypothetical protein
MRVLRPLLVATFLALSSTLAACGGGAAEGGGAVDPSKPPAKEVMGLTVLVTQGGSSEADRFAAALGEALSRSGFNVTNDAQAHADVALRASVVVMPDDAFMKVVVNGKSKLKYVVTVAVVADRPIDQLHVDYKTYEGDPPDEESVGSMVLAFAHSARVVAFAKQHGNAIAAASSEEAEWNAADPTQCKVPATLEACDAVRAYLVKHPQGKYAAEASRTLAAGAPTLERLRKDDNAWENAGALECRAQKTREACVGVEVYVAKFPAGMHAAEAKRLLAK